MRGFPTTTLLLAAALGSRAIASDESASSALANVDLGGDTQTIITAEEPDTTTTFILQPPMADEILEDMFPIEEEEGGWEFQPSDDLTEVEYLQLMIDQLQREIDARMSQFHEMDDANDAPESMLGSAFHKIVRFLTSFGAGNDETDLLDGSKCSCSGGKGGWHWPKFPFPPHHGRGNHTNGNHTFPPPHHGHGNHTFPPHHGNHTHHGHGNHTHGNHTHPPHHPPFRLPPHFCRPPHHKPPHHKPPPHKKPGDDDPPPQRDLEPPYQRPGEEPVFEPRQGYDSTLTSVLTALNHPLLEITLTPGSLILTSMICFFFARMFHRIRAVASRRRHYRYQRRQRLIQARDRFRGFISRMWSSAFSQRPGLGRHNEGAQDEKMPVPRTEPPSPGYYDHGDPYDGVFICRLHHPNPREDDFIARATLEYDTRVLFGDDWLKKHQPDFNNGGRNYDEKVAVSQAEAAGVKENEEEDLMSMSEEIASFREVADLVSDMVAAEEGRAADGTCR